MVIDSVTSVQQMIIYILEEVLVRIKIKNSIF
jgi:hypothetical protein